MPPKKRTTTKATATKRTTAAKTTATKRTTTKHVANTNTAPSTRLTKRSPAPTPPLPQASLRPANTDARNPPQLPQPTHEIIELSSTSPSPIQNNALEDRPYAAIENVPSNGIRPKDSTQDLVINSIEPLTADTLPIPPPPGFTAQEFGGHIPHAAPLQGLAHYLSLTAAHPHPTISASFNAYVAAPPPGIALRPRIPTPEPQLIDLGPSAHGVDYWAMPRRDITYSAPIYAGITTNPLIPFAVLKLVERNVPFVEWGAEKGFVPNAVGRHLVFPKEIEEGEGGWLEGFEGRLGVDGEGEDGGSGDGDGNGGPADLITTLFLPCFYLDGRHALLYFTRKSVSGRFAALLCTPCTTEELGRLGLLSRVAVSSSAADHDEPGGVETNGDGNFEERGDDEGDGAEDTDAEGTDLEPGSADPTIGISDAPSIGWEPRHDIRWTDMMIGVSNGRWIDQGVERGMWGEAVQVVGREWGIRMGLCVRVLAEGGPEARGRDGGMWGVGGVD